MYYFVLMRKCEGVYHLYGDIDDSFRLHWSSIYKITKQFSFHKLHYHVIHIAFSSYIVYGYNVWMAEFGRSPGFSYKAIYKISVMRKFRFQHFYSYVSLEQAALCFVHDRHTAFAYLLMYFVSTSQDLHNFPLFFYTHHRYIISAAVLIRLTHQGFTSTVHIV